MVKKCVGFWKLFKNFLNLETYPVITNLYTNKRKDLTTIDFTRELGKDETLWLVDSRRRTYAIRIAQLDLKQLNSHRYEIIGLQPLLTDLFRPPNNHFVVIKEPFKGFRFDPPVVRGEVLVCSTQYSLAIYKNNNRESIKSVLIAFTVFYGENDEVLSSYFRIKLK